MSYIATINNQTYTVDTGENGQQRNIRLDQTEHPIDWRQIAPLAADSRGSSSTYGGHYSLIISGQSYNIFARRITKPDQKDSQTYEIQFAGRRFEIKVEDERTRKLAGLARSGAYSGEAVIQAPMPGLVAGVLLDVGAEVQEGQTVVVLEAMKMENDLPSPITGKIKEVRVSKGQTVDQGQVLIVIEGTSEQRGSSDEQKR